MNPDFFWDKWPRVARNAAVFGFLGCVLGFNVNREQMLRSYWFAWLFFSGLGFGALAMVFLQYLTGGAWSRALQPAASAAIRTLPWMALLALPVLFGMRHIFPWIDEATHDWPHKARYLSGVWLGIRGALYFGVLWAGVWLLHELHLDPARRPKLSPGTVSGPALVAYVVCMNFASTDWIMSLEPEWYSTMFAVIFMVSQFLSALALCILSVIVWPTSRAALSPKALHDMGNLLLAFVVFWAYVSFSQFLIIWSGNLPREIAWYVHRRGGGWQWVAIFLALFQFALPFVLLLSRQTKRRARLLASIAAAVLGASLINIFWLTAPSFHPQGFSLHWLDGAALGLVGGTWLWVYLHYLREKTWLPALEEEVP